MKKETKNRLFRVALFFLVVFLINKVIEVNSHTKYYMTANNYIMITFAILLFVFVLFKDKENLVSKINSLEVITTLSSSLMFFVYYFYRINDVFVFFQNIYLNIYIDLILYICAIYLLMIAVVGLDLVKQFKREFVAIFVLLLNYVFLSFLLREVWEKFSYVVIKSNLIVLSLFGDVSSKGLELSFNNFSVIIGSPCSGIESFATFLGLFGLIFIVDMNKIDLKKYGIYFLIGLLITGMLNVVRISLIMLVGAFISQDFAINMFHENVGWILFVLFFGTYIYYVYPKLVN